MFYFAPRVCYKGSWKDDAMEGTGVYCFGSGARYEGSWKQGRQEGKGTGWQV